MSAIRAEMQLNATPFLAGIAKVQGQMRNLQAAAAGLTGVFLSVRSALSSMSAVFDGAKAALDLGGKFSDLSASTGASVSELVMLEQAFRNAGLGAEAVGPMIARFQKALAGVNEEGQSTQGALQKLGLNTLALGRMNVTGQFQELSRAFSEINDPAERTRRAMELFGRSGAQMLALFRDPEAFTRAAAEIGTMGDVLEQNAGRFDSMSDAITTLGEKMSQFFVGVMSQVGGDGALERMAKTDFTPVGQSIAAAGSSLTSWLPSLQSIEKYLNVISPMFRQINGWMRGTVIPQMADAKAKEIGSNTEQQVANFDARVRSVSSEEERVKLMNELSESIDQSRAKLDTLDTTLAEIPEDGRAKIADAISNQISLLDRQRTVLAGITPEILAANAAEADRAAALKASAAEAEKLAAQLDKALEARDTEAEKRVLSGLDPADAEQRVLSKLPPAQTEDAPKITTTEGVTAEIKRLRALGAETTDAEKARLVELIEAEKTLLSIKERAVAEDEKRAEQAARLSDLMSDLALESNKIVAEAAGDKNRVRELETQQAAKTMAKRFEQEGMDPAAAAELARAKAEADALRTEAGNIEAPRQVVGDAQRSIGLGGSAGLGPSVDVQKQIAKQQADANKHLSELVKIMNKRQPVMLAEVFD